MPVSAVRAGAVERQTGPAAAGAVMAGVLCGPVLKGGVVRVVGRISVPVRGWWVRWTRGSGGGS